MPKQPMKRLSIYIPQILYDRIESIRVTMGQEKTETDPDDIVWEYSLNETAAHLLERGADDWEERG